MDTLTQTSSQSMSPVTSKLPKYCQAAIFEGPHQDLALREVRIPTSLGPQAVLCKVLMSTICGSDLHTLYGRRSEPMPSILGHEIVGQIVDHGAGPLRDFNGQPLRVGDRITWSIMASCRECRYCQRGLPQKCVRLRKYGHLSYNEYPRLTGGYCEYVYLMPGTALFKVPEGLSNELVTPANCTLATAQNSITTIGLTSTDTVLIQGVGLLGLYLCALAHAMGCPHIVVTDIDASRLELARDFGADQALCVGDCSSQELVRRIQDSCPEGHLSVAFEVCGAQEAPAVAVDALDIGGRYLLAGLVTPNSFLNIDANQVIRKYLTVAGIHNYAPVHLQASLDFLQAHQGDYPFESIVGTIYPLARINEAVKEAASGRYIRVGVTN